jgi:hypothetical protein
MAIPMTCAYVREPAPASGRAPSGEFTLTRKPCCITAKFENSHPSFIGTLLGYENKVAIRSGRPDSGWFAATTG